MDNLLQPSLHATNEAEARLRLKEPLLVDDLVFPYAGISVQFSRLSKNRGTFNNGLCASGSQRLWTLAS
ncbi:MAG: hypothetical protein JWM21_452 [Acidobacteria bacterium]|nr:hypothetical protein [Acidobacteriota bacterium]